MGRGKYPSADDIKTTFAKRRVPCRNLCGADRCFNTDFSRYILADINSDLISLYNIVKLRTDEYVQASRELFMPEIQPC